jgi:hypothetical protein
MIIDDARYIQEMQYALAKWQENVGKCEKCENMKIWKCGNERRNYEND